MKNILRTATLLLFVIGYFQPVCAQVASFSASPTSGCSPLVVNFTNTSTGATSYSWNLGNGVTTPDVDASTSYTAPGTYTVTLTAYSGGSSNVHTMIITVFPSPTVSFYATDTAVCPGAPVYFVSTTSGGVPGAITYTWNFGDGTSGTGATPTHTFASPGYYNITLSATNSEGCTSSLTMPVYIHVYTPSVPDFTNTPIDICNPPGTVTFTNTTTGFGPFTSSWNFGDGSGYGSGSPTSHTYTAPGIYNVTLIETDGHGCTDSVTRPAAVIVSSITAAFTGPDSACLNSSVTFANTSSGATGADWNFGNGLTSTAIDGTTSYSAPGTYTITLVATNGGCSDTVRHTITVLPAPPASFVINPTEPCPPPTPVTFTASVPPGATVTWIFGDSTSGSGSPTTHTYRFCGTDTISMCVNSAFGCKDTIKETYTIYNLLLNINHDSIASGCVPLPVLFNCYASTDCPVDAVYPYPIISYTWNYGDGSPTVSGGSSTSHTYTAVGLYTCTVYVETANGCFDTAFLPVEVGTPPVPSFTAVPTTVCYGQPVNFINTTTGANGYVWEFGDGGTSTVTNPSYIYSLPGTYTVTLIAFDNGCPSEITGVVITVDSPMAVMELHYLCIPDNEVAFIDTSLGANSDEWFFGDGDTSSAKDTVHFYSALGIYTVMLTTYNIASGCRDTARAVVDLVHPTGTFSANDTAICRDAWATFSASVTDTGVSGYVWSMTGSVTGPRSGRVVTDTFHTTGWQTVTLVIVDAHGCLDTFTKPNYILVAKPVAHFTETPDTGCVILLVNFTDGSTDVTGATIDNYAWTFGDGGSASVTSPTTAHSYTTAGSFLVTEIVTDNIGCKDTVTGAVVAHQPHAAFYAVPTYACAGSVISFFNTSSSTLSSYWNFGDGTSSSATSPTHIYSAVGVYTVKLAIIDTNGCPDTATYVDYIHITAPVASFNESDSFSICVPLNEVFTNTSTGAVSYYWTFGDGSSSADVNPTDLYIDTGRYVITLVATNSYGCTDTARETVVIYGYAGGFSYTPDSGCVPLLVHFSCVVSNVSSIIWDFGDGTTSSAHSTEDTVHSYVYPGAYIPKLILSDLSNCQNSSIGVDTIKVDAVIATYSNTPACIDDTVHFLDSATSYWSVVNSWLWSFGPGDSSAAMDPVYLYTATGTYTVSLQATDAWGCTATNIRSLTITGLPTITASGDTTVCVGDNATLIGYGGVTYSWSPGTSLSCTLCNPAAASPTVATTYTVTGRNAEGCPNTDTVTVHVKTKTTSVAFGDTAVCDGTIVPLWDSGANKFTWIPPFGLSSTTMSSVNADPATTITYSVIAQLGSCLPDTNTVTVTIWPLPTVNAGANQLVLAGSTVQLQATGTNINTYEWTPSSSLSCDNCYNPVGAMSVSTTYTVNVTSIHDCFAFDTVIIDVYCANSQIFVPNTFTPNGDGQDDVFYPRGTGVENIKSFRIYNRWGELLFERDNFQTNDASAGWDGTFGGAPPRPDVYVYVLYATCETGQPLFLKGDVTIVK